MPCHAGQGLPRAFWQTAHRGRVSLPHASLQGWNWGCRGPVACWLLHCALHLIQISIDLTVLKLVGRSRCCRSSLKPAAGSANDSMACGPLLNGALPGLALRVLEDAPVLKGDVPGSIPSGTAWTTQKAKIKLGRQSRVNVYLQCTKVKCHKTQQGAVTYTGTGGTPGPCSSAT